MTSPYQRLYILTGIVLCLFLISTFFRGFSFSERKTTEKIKEIKELLENEKKYSGTYPEELKMIIRNNPLRMSLLRDSWGNVFKYTQLANGKSYELLSLGKDGKLNTDDDIKYVSIISIEEL